MNGFLERNVREQAGMSKEYIVTAFWSRCNSLVVLANMSESNLKERYEPAFYQLTSSMIVYMLRLL